jgi:hypothetical protein
MYGESRMLLLAYRTVLRKNGRQQILFCKMGKVLHRQMLEIISNSN